MTSNWSGDYNIGSNAVNDTLLLQNYSTFHNTGNCHLGYGFGDARNSAVIQQGCFWQISQSLHVGRYGAGNTLTITDGGALLDAAAYVGEFSNNNSVWVIGNSSSWSTVGQLYIGEYGSGNSLVIDNGGRVVATAGYVGYGLPYDGNNVVVTGANSILTNDYLVVGYGSSYDSMVISNGGKVVDRSAVVGFYGGCNYGDFNSVRVATGGVWQNDTLVIGNQGFSNSLVVAGGTVIATNLVVGAQDTCTFAGPNLVELDSGSLTVTNAAHNGSILLNIGGLVLNGGTVQADVLSIANRASIFHGGGTLIVGSVIVDPNAFHIVSVMPQGQDTLITFMMGPGITNALQAAGGDATGGYNANGFSDIFVVTNNPTAGTVTNYLDVGGATNQPSRYYRVRLIP